MRGTDKILPQLKDILNKILNVSKDANCFLNLIKEKNPTLLCLTQQNDIGIVIQNESYQVLYVNPFVEEIAKIEPGTLCYRAFKKLDKPCGFCPLKMTIQCNQKALYCIDFTSDGSFYKMYTIPFGEIKDKRVVIKALKRIRDKTSNVLFNEYIKQARLLEAHHLKYLKELNRRFKQLFETANDAIFIADAKTGMLIDCNDKAGLLTGYSKAELLLMHQSHLHPPEKRIYYANLFKKHVNIGRNFAAEEEIMRKDGLIVPVSISVSVVKLGNRKIIQGIFTDITEVKKIEEERQRLKILEEEKQKLEQFSLIDPLTEMFNYRYLKIRLEAECKESKRYSKPLSILAIDVDYFKSINDVYGYELGDKIICELANIIRKNIREIDVAVRYEGATFIIIVPNAGKADVMKLSRRLKYTIDENKFAQPLHNIRLKVSMAIVSYPEDGVAISGHTFHLIDLIFRQIKEKGGNIISDAQILSEHDDNSDLDRIMSGVSIKRVHRKLERLIKRINQTTLETIYALVETMRAKDSYTQEHSMSMVLYAEEMGRILGLPERDIENLKLGAMLHDIGKVGISDKILQKKGPLTEGEFGIIKKHPLIGAEIVRRVHFLKDVVPILLHHHEAFDGTGYVGHLKGEEIPLLARITSIVDVYQALISKRSYRRAYNQEEAIDILKKESRTKFDPSLVEIFIKLVSSKANK